jgi:hypothetical protein
MFVTEIHPVELTTLLTRSFVGYFFYADPGSGTLVWQLLLAAFFGGMFYFRRLKDLVIHRKHLKSRGH